MRILRELAVVLTVAAAMGLIGGMIGHFWAHGFTISKDDKFDIFVSLLALIGTIFGGAGAGLYAWLQGRVQRASEDLALRAQRGVDRTQFLLDSYFAINIWELGQAGFTEDQNRTFNELALRLAIRANDFTETSGLTEGGPWDREQIMRNASTLVWLYAHLNREDRRNQAYQLAETLQQWIEGKEDDEWEIAESCNYLRFKLPRRNRDRDNASDFARTLIARIDLEESTKEMLRQYYGLD